MIGKPLPTDRTVDRAEVITPPPPRGPAQTCRQALRGRQVGGWGSLRKVCRRGKSMVDSLQLLQPFEVDGGVGFPA